MLVVPPTGVNFLVVSAAFAGVKVVLDATAGVIDTPVDWTP